MKVLHSTETKRKTAVITGASSGIGREIAARLVNMNYHVVLVGRNERSLLRLCEDLGKENTTALSADLSCAKECVSLYKFTEKYTLDVFINNAGFGLYGEFVSTPIKAEMKMIDVNIKAVHILMKLYLREFMRRNRGYILNVASSAGFMPGPFMSTYYSTKNYVVAQTLAVREEVRRKGSRVKICVLCPGPVDTDFNRSMGIGVSAGSISAGQCADDAVKGLFEGKNGVIIPTDKMKLVTYLSRIFPVEFSAFVNYYIQRSKKKI